MTLLTAVAALAMVARLTATQTGRSVAVVAVDTVARLLAARSMEAGDAFCQQEPHFAFN